jgi:DNA-binding transcriptional LysR family regulator
MKLNSDQLAAFFQVSQLKSFSKAARALFISQPALTQRIQKLEEFLGTPLFIRKRGDLKLTESGQKLLRHCRLYRDLEESLLQDFNSDPLSGSLSGVIRIAAFGSVTRSLVLPALKDLLEQNPGVTLEVLNREWHELPELLKGGQADLVITQKPISPGPIESVLLGHEHYVLIESARRRTKCADLYFDTDPADPVTYDFWKLQKKKKDTGKLRRAFLDEIYTILDAVELGWGRAIVPRHLLQDSRSLRVIPGHTPWISPVYLNYFEQPFYSKLFQKARAELKGSFSKLAPSNGPCARDE